MVGSLFGNSHLLVQAKCTVDLHRVGHSARVCELLSWPPMQRFQNITVDVCSVEE